MELNIDEIVNSLTRQISEQAKTIAVLEATISKMQKPKTFSTAVDNSPKVVGTQGIQTAN
jgi:hypothetical protein